MQWRKRWHFKLNERSLYNTLSIQLILGGIYICGSSTQDMKSCFESWCVSQCLRWRWKVESEKICCPCRGAPQPQQRLCSHRAFLSLPRKQPGLVSEQTQFVGSLSDWCSSPRRGFSRGLAEPAGSMNGSSYSKETQAELHKLSHIPLYCAELGKHARQTWKSMCGCWAIHRAVHT